MIRALSTAATGMEAQQTRLDVTANNIANVSTPGFKKGRAEFEDLMYQTLQAPGASTSGSSMTPTGAQVGLGTRIVGVQREYSIGDLRQTDNPFDVSINGEGFFQVILPNGQTAYTRAGQFKKDNEGKLVDGNGYSLASEISIPPDATKMKIAADGLVSVSMADGTSQEIGRIELATFVNPAGLSAEGKNLFIETAASGTAIVAPPGEAGTGSLSQGQLELSNVKVVEEMIDLISGQRAYEVNSRVIKAADEMLQQTANLR